MSILNKGNLKVWRHIINLFLIKYKFIICTGNTGCTGYTGCAGCTGCNNLKNYLRLILKVHIYIIKKLIFLCLKYILYLKFTNYLKFLKILYRM